MAPSPDPAADPGSHRASTAIRRRLIGAGSVALAVAVTVAAGPLARFLYSNHEELPSQIARQMYPSLYSLNHYEIQFLLWAIWPAGVLALVGTLLLAVDLLPASVSGRLEEYQKPLILWGIAVLGLVLRSRAYFEQRSLWLDEVLLATNFRNNSLGGLLGSSLSNSQSAPPGFLILVEAVSSVFGLDELILRLVPFAFGAGAVFLAVPVAQRLFGSSPAQIAFVGLLAFSPVLVYYSQELKQYSADVFVTVAVLWMWTRRRELSNSWLYGIVGLFLVQLSITAVFSLTALGFLLVFEHFFHARPTTAIGTAIRAHWRSFSLWLSGGVVHGLYLIVSPPNYGTMRPLWESTGGFPPGEGPVSMLSWAYSRLSQLVWLAFGHEGIAVPLLGGPDYFVVPALILLGAAAAFSIRRSAPGMVLIGVSFLVSFLGLYPFSSRLSLYLIPAVALLTANAVSLLGPPKPLVRHRLVGLSIPLLFIWPVMTSFATFAKPASKYDMTWLISEVEARSGPSDLFSTADEFVYSWYRPSGPGAGASYIPMEDLLNTPNTAVSNRLWIISFGEYQDPELEDILQDSHKNLCSTTVQESTLTILVPVENGPAHEMLCEFRNNKF